MLTKDEAFRLSRFSFEDLAASAGALRDEFSMHHISYSPNVTIPLTQLCRDSCEYCAFAKTPDELEAPYMSIEQIHSVCEKGVAHLCGEALFTLGESPESKYDQARAWLNGMGLSTTSDYLVQACRMAIIEFGLLPHVNAGSISDREIRALKEVSVSQGMMLESIAGRLGEPGGPHFGSPDKTPARRLATLEAAGRAQVPFTTGILVGIGDTRHERIQGLLAIRDLNARYGHIQEVIIHKFLPKAHTPMESVEPATDEEQLWSIAAARLIFENDIHIQAAPNLSASPLDLIRAGVDDFGGISPVSIDYINPERPWIHLETLTSELLSVGRKLRARSPIYPEYINKAGFIAQHLKPFVDKLVDNKGYLLNSPLTSGDSNKAKNDKHLSDQIINEIDLTDSKTISPQIQIKPNPRSRKSNLPTSRPV